MLWPGKAAMLGTSAVLLSHVQLFATPWTVARQAPLSVEFSGKEYWSGLPCPSPGDLPDAGIKPRSPALQSNSLPSEPPGKPMMSTSPREETAGTGALAGHPRTHTPRRAPPGQETLLDIHRSTKTDLSPRPYDFWSFVAQKLPLGYGPLGDNSIGHTGTGVPG